MEPCLWETLAAIGIRWREISATSDSEIPAPGIRSRNAGKKPETCRKSYRAARELLGRSAAMNSLTGRVLSTSLFSIHPRRAVVTPYFMKARFRVA